jgi:dihydropyrimidine dehydrogenase (NAD+) subunit PreA
MVINKDLSGGGLSVFGSFMLPITAQYTETMVKAGFEVCAGGGVTNGESATNLLLLGASSVQVATDVLLKGYQRFTDLNKEINEIHKSGPPVFFQGWHDDAPSVNEPSVGKRHAKIDAGLCNPVSCKQECIRQAFCSHVYMKEGKPSFKGCEGCGLCAVLCPCHAVQMAQPCVYPH